MTKEKQTCKDTSRKLRLDKYLADMKAGSRSEVRLMIQRGRVEVNGISVRDAGFKAGPADRVTLDGRELSYTSREYIMLNKPAGVLSATADRKQRTVLDLIPDAKRRDLFPVGRLDKDTEGLLLIINDGALAHRLLSPRKHVEKVYYARVLGEVTNREKELFAAGIMLGDDFRAMPARLEILSVRTAKTGSGISAEENPEKAGSSVPEKAQGSASEKPACRRTESEIRLAIQEGKFHQVKRMFEAVGMKVLYLKRLSIGSLVLDDGLAPGEYRRLTEQELECLREGTPEKEEAESFGYPAGTELLNRMLDRTEAVIFDLDGTLVDSMWMWQEIDIEYLGKFGIPLPEGLQACIEGMSFSETAGYFKKNFPAITDSIEEMKAEWNRMAWDKYVNEVPLKPGAREFLKLLRERNIKTGIATSNSRELVWAVLKSLSAEQYFDEVHTACEVAAGKPSPDIFLLVADRLQTAPEHCLVFEDIRKGIQAGKAAGMRVCAVQDEYSREDRERKAAEADYFIDSYFDLGLKPERNRREAEEKPEKTGNNKQQ